jgi:LmbE family N-acetylglucosaminyl deacetylase
MQVKDYYNEIFKNVETVLVVMPHPDDLELYCGGTVARLVEDGKKVVVVKMTNGENGSRQEKITSQELGKIRMQEDKASMEVLGIKSEDNVYLNLGDGSVGVDKETIGQLALQIRLVRPDLIITTNPEDEIIRFGKDQNWFNHTDHLNTGKSVLRASYPFARDVLFYPEHFKNPNAKSHTCVKFLLTDFYDHEDNVFIKVTDQIKTRVDAHAKHSSQYSKEDAQDSADFFTKKWDKAGIDRFETFRYVLAD